jgi:hypothetical protein
MLEVGAIAEAGRRRKRGSGGKRQNKNDDGSAAGGDNERRFIFVRSSERRCNCNEPEPGTSTQDRQHILLLC